MQVKMEASTMLPPAPAQPVPDIFAQFFYDDPAAVTSDAQPVNATEAALVPLLDDQQRVRSVSCLPKFFHVLQSVKTELDETLVLIALRATATASDAKLSKACTSAFEKLGGLKIAKKWLNEAVEWNYSDLLVLLLDVLKVLPVQLTSITEARINEPIVKLRKTAQEDKVRRAAQDLLKHWRGRFTEKEKEKEKEQTKAASVNAKTSIAEPTPTKTTTTTTSSTPSAAPKTVAEAALKDAQPLKKRPIKRLERTPGSSAASAGAPSKSSELIGNLMQRKSAKEAPVPRKSSSSSDNKDSSSKVSSSKQASSADDSSKKQTSKAEPSMQLPAIQSFNAAVATVAVSKKIRWADEEGKELVKIKLIESWRDMIHYQPHEEGSFKDAKLREHEAERQAMRSHKERESFHVPMSHEWVTPALVAMPEALAGRRSPVATEEVETQSARTRREMEFLVLDGEVPPLSPKEWTRTNEPHRGAPKEIPLLDVDSANAASSAPVTASYMEPGETEEERALREALGPLQRSTIALLMENEHVLPMVYEEAQRNGNRIPDGRVVEIIDYHGRRGPPAPLHHQYNHHQGPPPQQQQRFNAPPPTSQGYDGGYSKYGGGPPPGPAPGAYDYNHAPYGAHQQQPLHHVSHKRKAPGGGILADAPPSKRIHKRGPGGAPLQCMYFMAPGGCKHGNTCQYAHEIVDGGAGGPGDYGHPVSYGGRGGFGHQPPMGMRGGGPGGMRGMRGGR